MKEKKKKKVQFKIHIVVEQWENGKKTRKKVPAGLYVSLDGDDTWDDIDEVIEVVDKMEWPLAQRVDYDRV